MVGTPPPPDLPPGQPELDPFGRPTKSGAGSTVYPDLGPPPGNPPAQQWVAIQSPVTQLQPQSSEKRGLPPGAPAVGIPGCPPGLEYLTQLDMLQVHQQVELFEALTDIETKNKFSIKNSVGQQCYFAYEESGVCMRLCCQSQRGFKMHIVDNSGREVITMTRPLKCCAGCCWCAHPDGCCSHQIDVVSALGQLLGSIHQTSSCWIQCFEIRDASGAQVFKIEGPCCICYGPCCMCDQPFTISTATGRPTQIGAITKVWSGCAKECFTDATNFNMTFPQDLDVKMKAVLLGALFLIDIMFFEKDDN